MEQTNLAAAILRCAGSGLVRERLEKVGDLTNEEAVNLADWLRCESSIKAWRGIYLTPATTRVDPTGTACCGSYSLIF
jgi:hypothetical protein